MKRTVFSCALIAIFSIITLSNSYGGRGKEAWYKQVITVACSYSGTQSIALGGSFGSGQMSFTGGASESGTIVYAHYPGEAKSCEGWYGDCVGSGATRVTSFTPIAPCLDRN